MMPLEYYRELFRITEWRDGCVYRTVPLATAWFPAAEVDGNIPADTGVMYVAASDEYAQNNSCVRAVRKS